MKTEVTAVACEHTGRTSTYNDNNYSTSAEGPANAGLGKGLRGNVCGGHRLSNQVGAADVLAGPESTEPGSDSTSRQMRLLADLLVSAVPYGVLRELAQAQVRRECRRCDFDWDAFVADCPEWGITEVVHRRAVQQVRDRGLDCRPTDILTDTVLSAVRGVIDGVDSRTYVAADGRRFSSGTISAWGKGSGDTAEACWPARGAGVGAGR